MTRMDVFVYRRSVRFDDILLAAVTLAKDIHRAKAPRHLEESFHDCGDIACTIARLTAARNERLVWMEREEDRRTGADLGPGVLGW